MEQQLGNVLDDQLVAGLWRNRLLEELCWFRTSFGKKDEPSKPMKWRAPTWSWVYSDAIARMSNTTKMHRHCETKEMCCDVDHLDFKADLLGML